MAESRQRSQRLRKQSARERAEHKAAVSAYREEFLREFRAKRQANAVQAHKQMKKAVPGILEYYMREAERREETMEKSDTTEIRRRAFSKQLDEWCATFPELLKKFTEGLCRLRYAIDWVHQEAEKVLPYLGEEGREWVMTACDGQPAAQGWYAPGWLAAWPAEIDLPANALWKRLNGAETQEVLKAVSDQLVRRLADAEQIAINHARILIVERRQSANYSTSEPSLKNEHDRQPTKLPAKINDLSALFDAAKLTNLQREVASLSWEYKLRVTEIARRLGRHRKTIDEYRAAASKKINEAKSRDQSAKKRAVTNPGEID